MVLIMEYVSGGELTKLVESKSTYGLTETEANKIFTQLANAVSYCHNHFVIHRDLKPENLLLDDPKTLSIKLIDFGIAGNNYGKSKDPTTAGSLYILPPEALEAQSVNADPSIDIWAMGVILYFMLFGIMPFRGLTEKEIINNIIKKNVEFTKERKTISKTCKNLILSLLKKNPKERIKMDDIYAHEWFNLK
jgi:serine/threonine protein kinase